MVKTISEMCWNVFTSLYWKQAGISPWTRRKSWAVPSPFELAATRIFLVKLQGTDLLKEAVQSVVLYYPVWQVWIFLVPTVIRHFLHFAAYWKDTTRIEILYYKLKTWFSFGEINYRRTILYSFFNPCPRDSKRETLFLSRLIMFILKIFLNSINQNLKSYKHWQTKRHPFERSPPRPRGLFQCFIWDLLLFRKHRYWF